MDDIVAIPWISDYAIQMGDVYSCAIPVVLAWVLVPLSYRLLLWDDDCVPLRVFFVCILLFFSFMPISWIHMRYGWAKDDLKMDVHWCQSWYGDHVSRPGVISFNEKEEKDFRDCMKRQGYEQIKPEEGDFNE